MNAKDRRDRGRPIRLDGMQLGFVLNVADGLPPAEAARAAGYVAWQGGRLLSKPHVADAVRVMKILDPMIRSVIRSVSTAGAIPCRSGPPA